MVEVREAPTEKAIAEFSSFMHEVTPEGESINNYPALTKESGYIATGRMLKDTGMPAAMFPEGEKSLEYYNKHLSLRQKVKDSVRSPKDVLTLEELKNLHTLVADENERPGRLRDENVTATLEKNGNNVKWVYPESGKVLELGQKIEEWQKNAIGSGVDRRKVGEMTAQMVVASQLFSDANSRVADLIKHFYQN